MTIRPFVRRRALAPALVGLTLAGALLGASTPASAAGTPGAAATASTAGKHQAEVVCTRAPKVELRVTRALARLNGPAGERGSIARMQKRVDVAAKAGNTAIETYLNDRLTARKAMVGTLTTRQNDLKQVETWCAANGNGGS
jgi:hypothetical protein